MEIPDPVELMEARIEREMERVDADGTYPCAYCERRFPVESMQPISADPGSPLGCARDDCDAYQDELARRKQEMQDARDGDWKGYYP